MERIELTSWSQFKEICVANKNLNCQYWERANSYDLFGPDSGMIMWCFNLPKTASADLDDFEDNHKVNFNWAIGSRLYSFASSDFEFVGKAVSGTATKNAATNFDLAMDEDLYCDGGHMFVKNAKMGDWLQCQVVHPQAGVIKTWIDKWYVPPASTNDPPLLSVTTPYAGKILSGLTMRLVYNSTATALETAAEVAINYRLHRPI